MGKEKRNTVITSASVPRELYELMKSNNISPSEAMRTGILRLLENREFLVVNEEIEKLLDSKVVIQPGDVEKVDDMIDKVPLYQLPDELKAKKIARNIYERVKDVMMVEKFTVMEMAAGNQVPYDLVLRELESLGITVSST